MRGTWTPERVIAVVIGGVAGASLRWGVLACVTPGRFPWPVLAINVVGSALLGVFLGEEPVRPTMRTLLHDAGGIGLCGGLTTFSTFALEVVNLVRADHTTIAVTYALASVVGAIVGVVVGAAAFRRMGALTLPLGEKP